MTGVIQLNQVMLNAASTFISVRSDAVDTVCTRMISPPVGRDCVWARLPGGDPHRIMLSKVRGRSRLPSKLMMVLDSNTVNGPWAAASTRRPLACRLASPWCLRPGWF
jgi:hypothetical protein